METTDDFSPDSNTQHDDTTTENVVPTSAEDFNFTYDTAGLIENSTQELVTTHDDLSAMNVMGDYNELLGETLMTNDEDVTLSHDYHNGDNFTLSSFEETNQKEDFDETPIDTQYSFPNQTDSTSESFQEKPLTRLDLINKRIADELAAKIADENKRKETLRQQAQSELDLWYKERDRQMTQKRQRMKNEEETLLTTALEKSDKHFCDWTKVIRLLDFSPGTPLSKSQRDLSRIKSAMLNAARNKETN